MMRSQIIITDAVPLGDDGIALAMLIADRPIDIKLIVATSGNVWAEEVAENVRVLLKRLRRPEIEICIGLPSSALQGRQRAYARESISRTPLLYSGALDRKPPAEPAATLVCDDLFAAITASGRPDMLVLGPASTLAAIIRDHADFVDHVGHVFLMGGVLAGPGNATPAAEFNFWFDPEAAETVLASDLPVTLLPLDVVRELRYPENFAAELDPKHPATTYIRDCVARVPPPPVCDEVIAAIVMDPNLVTRSRRLKLAVETAPGSRYGAVNLLGDDASRRPIKVIDEIGQGAFWELARRIFNAVSVEVTSTDRGY